MLGTTHATNAVLERRQLQRVAVIRIGAPGDARSIRPLFGWPEDLRAAVSAGEAIVGGGIEFDGREIVAARPRRDRPVPRERRRHGRGRGDRERVLAGLAAPRAGGRARSRGEVLGDDVHGLAQPRDRLDRPAGAGERDRAQRRPAPVARERGRRAAGGARAPRAASPVMFFTQNDGTLMALDYALRYPVLTIGCGPANSMRGAAFLTGRRDAMVVDVGGTSTDVGVLTGGFPRESAAAVEIGGVRTNFRMPDLVTIALGGGTWSRATATASGSARESVGYRLTRARRWCSAATPPR